MANNSVQKVRNAWQMYANPLAYLTQAQIRNMMQQARVGNDIRLQIAFYDCERVTPLFGVCIDKRQAGVLKRKWQISPVDESAAAKAQAEAVQKVFDKSNTRNNDGLTNALQSFVLGAFRGRAVIKPFLKDGELVFKQIPNWNTLAYNSRIFWNPDAEEGLNFLDGSADKLQELTEDEVCSVLYDRPIDLPGIDVYLRLLIGETQWARFVEKEGVPQVLITPPEGTPESLTDEWVNRAIGIMEGGSGILPPGSSAQVLTAARGQDPFSLFLAHQYETIVLLALGQKMTSLGEAAGLGSNLADVQQGEFDNLVTRDCRLIQNTLTRCAVKKVCREMLHQEQLCKFEFTEDEDTTPAEYLDMALKIQQLGGSVDLQKLKELTGLSFISDSAKDVWRPAGE